MGGAAGAVLSGVNAKLEARCGVRWLPVPVAPLCYRPGVHATAWGVVLAGGKSRRLGIDKATLEIDGETLLDRAVSTLEAVFDDVAVVGRARWSGGRGLADLEGGQGPLGGIRTALRHRPGRDVFVLACDLPAVDVRLVRWLVDRAARESGPVTYPRVGGVTQPLCGVWSAACLTEIERFLSEGRRGVRELLGRLGARPVDLGPSEPVYRPDLLANLNRPEDLEASAAHIAIVARGATG